MVLVRTGLYFVENMFKDQNITIAFWKLKAGFNLKYMFPALTFFLIKT